MFVIDNVNGYRPFNYHGTRFSSHRLVYEMCETLRLLGVNGLRSPAEFLLDDVTNRKGVAAGFSRGILTRGMGYPVPSAKHLRANQVAPEGAGCPYGPGLEERTVAVLRFRGRPAERNVERKTNELMAAVRANGLLPQGEPVLMMYNPPFVPGFLRRNEVGVVIRESES